MHRPRPRPRRLGPRPCAVPVQTLHLGGHRVGHAMGSCGAEGIQVQGAHSGSRTGLCIHTLAPESIGIFCIKYRALIQYNTSRGWGPRRANIVQYRGAFSCIYGTASGCKSARLRHTSLEDQCACSRACTLAMHSGWHTRGHMSVPLLA